MSSKDTLSSAPAAAQVTEPHQQQRLASSSSPPRPLATSPANPPLRSFARSISFEQGASQSQQAASTSSSKPLPPPLYLDGSSSSSSKSHDKRPPGSSSSSASSPTRARSRSLGAKSRDQQWRPLSEHAQLGEELDRGSGTPDYVLGRMAQNNGKGKGRLHDIVREGDAGGECMTLRLLDRGHMKAYWFCVLVSDSQARPQYLRQLTKTQMLLLANVQDSLPDSGHTSTPSRVWRTCRMMAATRPRRGRVESTIEKMALPARRTLHRPYLRFHAVSSCLQRGAQHRSL